MQSEENIRKVLDAALENEFGEDESMEAVRDLLKWILGYESLVPANATADQFIAEFITDPYV